MKLNELNPNLKNKPTKRVGRGAGSGLGKTSGKGHKGSLLYTSPSPRDIR